ncbi:MAG: MFS transporter [Clostridiales Family XIII bacterium]|jgi:MFS family permease|nr:MFS transporter [Clostridiales Family XIII bacterium]
MFRQGEKGKQILVLSSVLLIYIIVTGFNATSIAIMLPEWAAQFNLTDIQIGLLGGGISIGAIITVFISGIIFDKVRNYKNLYFAILMVNGILISLRYFAKDFGQIYLLIFLYGVTTSFVGTGGYKILPQWFDSKSLYVALGMVTSGGSIGYILGFLVTPRANAAIGWANLFLWQGIIIIIIGLILVFIIPFRRESEGAMNTDMNVKVEEYTLGRKIREIFKSRQVWMSICADFLMAGAVLSLSQIGPIALIAYWGIDATQAGTVLASSSFGSLVGYWVVPSIINKIGYRKRLFVPAGVVGLVLLCIPLLTKNPTIAMILLACGGFLNAISLLGPRSIMLEHPTVAGIKAGTASGVLLTTNKLACVFYPVFFMALYSGGLVIAWICYFVLALIGVVFIMLSDETGPKGRVALYKKYNIPLPEDAKAAEKKA